MSVSVHCGTDGRRHMDSKKISIVSVIATVLALVLAIGVSTAFSACGPKEDGTWMHCHDVQVAILACGVVATVVLAAATVIKEKGARIALYAVAVVVCIVVLALPSVMPMCMVDTMRCHAVMAPFARVVAVLVGVLSVVSLVQAVNADKKNLPKYGEL